MLATTLAKSRKTPTTMAADKEQCSDIPSLPLTPTIYNHSTNSGHSTYSGNSTYSGRFRPFPRLRLFCWFKHIQTFDCVNWLFLCMTIPLTLANWPIQPTLAVSSNPPTSAVVPILPISTVLSHCNTEQTPGLWMN
jgi:hypothetical protein